MGDNYKLYSILGLNRNASQDEINFFNANNPDVNKYTFICAFVDSSFFIKNLI